MGRMEEKAESEQSFSGESSSSSGSSSASTEGEDEAMEMVRILGQTIELPQELCEDYGVFREFFSMKTWEELEDDHKESLKELLPKFPENDMEEKEKTIKMLFECEPFHFTSPLDDFFNNLRQGNYRPDIAKMRKFLKKARAKQQRHRVSLLRWFSFINTNITIHIYMKHIPVSYRLSHTMQSCCQKC